MIRNFTQWLDLVGGQVSKAREEESGRVMLTFFSDEDEEFLRELWNLGVKPKDAAAAYFERREP
jgi:hypothetical protein